MSNPFFDHPILNSPYTIPARHWELDENGQPTQQIVEKRRSAQFITPCTRARDELLVAGVEPASEFLDDFTKPLASLRRTAGAS